LARFRRGGRDLEVDTLNSACLDSAETPPPVRDTTVLRAHLPAWARWYRFRALPDSMGSAMFLYLGLQRLAGPGTSVWRAEAESLADLLAALNPPVLVLACGPVSVLHVWLRDRSQLLTWLAMRLPGS
jgi:hypothetical protein